MLEELLELDEELLELEEELELEDALLELEEELVLEDELELEDELLELEEAPGIVGSEFPPHAARLPMKRAEQL